MPITMTDTTIPHLGGLGSKSSYRGVKTITSVPASRRASPIISFVNFLVDKVTSVLRGLFLSSFGQFPVFEVSRGYELEKGITKQKRILSVIESPCHLLKVGR